MKGDKQKVPSPVVNTKRLVGQPCIELSELIQAVSGVMGAVYIVPETISHFLIEPAAKVRHKSCPCGRKIEHEQYYPCCAEKPQCPERPREYLFAEYCFVQSVGLSSKSSRFKLDTICNFRHYDFMLVFFSNFVLLGKTNIAICRSNIFFFQ